MRSPPCVPLRPGWYPGGWDRSSPGPAVSVPLGTYRAHPGCGVLVICRGCELQRDYDLEAVIARLNRRGLVGDRVGVKHVADYLTRPCPRCSGRLFETRPAWSRMDNRPPRPPYGGF